MAGCGRGAAACDDPRPAAAAAPPRPAPDLADGGAAGQAALVDSVQADLQAAEAHYDKAIQGLEQIARSDTGELDPQVAAVLQKNLQVIDQAIGESRAALKTQPASADAQDSLFERCARRSRCCSRPSS